MAIALADWGGWPLLLGVAALTAIGLGEFYFVAQKAGARPYDLLGRLGAFLLLASAYLPHGQGILWLAVVVLAAGSLIGPLIRRSDNATLDLGATLLGTLYVGGLFAYLLLLRGLSDAPVHLRWLPWPVPAGTTYLLLPFLATWGMDAGAYFVGRTWGRRKLAPRLSPHKTVEGAVGALVTAAVITVVFGLWFQLPAGHMVALGALFGVAGQVGDLGKSVFKRQAGVKDYGSIIPGHGGVLDRFDSLLFCAPVAYYYLYLLLHFHLPLFDL